MKLNRRVTIITRFSGIMFSLLLLGGLAACSDDNNGNDTPEPEPSTYPTTPFSKIELKEVIESDAQPVTATHTYLYNSAGRLTGYTGKQSFTAGDELFEIENTTTVEYKDHQAVITDEAGTVSTYTLNDKGYATTCTSQDMAEIPVLTPSPTSSTPKTNTIWKTSQKSWTTEKNTHSLQ